MISRCMCVPDFLSRLPLLKIVALAVILTALLCGPAFSQRRPAPKPPTAKPKIAEPDVQTTKIEIDDPLNDYVEKGLPESSAINLVFPDKAVVEAAKKIEAFDDESLPTLLAAIRASGFALMDRDRKIISLPEKARSQGLAFYDFETVGMLKLSRRGIVTTLNDWMGLATKDNEVLQRDVVTKLLLDDLRANYNSKVPQLRFWARLIVELGRNAEIPQDLMAVASPAEARLDIVQASLWERRLTGDLVRVQEALEGVSLRKPGSVRSPYIVKAAFTPLALDAPCQMNDNQALIVDGAANVISTAHGKLLEFMEKAFEASSKAGQAISKFASAANYANIALSWGKLIAANMMLKAELNVEEPLPLVRTVNSVPGEKRLMKAKVWSEVGNLSYLNCVRTALNTATGLDFSVPSDGPLADRDVGWQLTGSASFYGQKSSKTGVFKPFVLLEAPEGAKRNPDEQISDSEGVSRMNLIGAPKIPAVAYFKAVKVKKTAGVRVSIALKSPRDTAQNFIDIGGAALGIATGGPLGILSALPELGFRMKRPIVSKSIPVEDKEPCEENWIGTITFTRKNHFSQRSAKSTRTTDSEEVVEYYVKGKRPTEPPKDLYGQEEMDETSKQMWADMLDQEGLAQADLYVRVMNTERETGTTEADICCPNSEGKEVRYTETRESFGDQKREVVVKFDLKARDLDFQLIDFTGGAFKGTYRRTRTTDDAFCDLDKSGDGVETREEFFGMSIGRDYTFPLDIKTSQGVDTISGSKTQTSPGGEYKVTWELSRCG